MRSYAITPHRGLRAVFWLRVVSLLGQAACLLAAHAGAIHLVIAPLLALTIALALLCVATAWRLTRDWPITDLELTTQLLLDIALLSGFLYFTGGPYNPFVSLYLVPVAMAASTLPVRHAWLVAAASAGAYTLLMVWHEPLPHIHGDAFNLHVIGMWLNFLLSAALIAGFVSALAYGLRQREALLAQARETALRKERIVALGALAAGAAHELSTPLNTMLITVSELQAAPESAPLRDDLKLLREQIELCKSRLRDLLATHDRQETTVLSVRQWLSQIIHDWQRLRPEILLSSTWAETVAHTSIRSQPALAQCLSSLLNNAADASQQRGNHRVTLTVTLEAGLLCLLIDDEGPGPSASLMQNAGRVFFTDKPQGFGLGLVLSDATLNSLSGELRLSARAQGGTRAEVRVPLSALQ